jgi:hypothetical protein
MNRVQSLEGRSRRTDGAEPRAAPEIFRELDSRVRLEVDYSLLVASGSTRLGVVMDGLYHLETSQESHQTLPRCCKARCRVDGRT